MGALRAIDANLIQLTLTKVDVPNVQVELISRSGEGNAEVKHIINLQRDLLTSEILVSNSSTSSLHLLGSAICHLAVSTPDATYALGLEGSDYFIRPPFAANFSIIPPDFKRTDRDPRKFWAFNKLFSKWNARNWNVEDDVESLVRDIKEELEGEEEDNYKHLTEKLSRIYTSAPRSLTIIDRVSKCLPSWLISLSHWSNLIHQNNN